MLGMQKQKGGTMKLSYKPSAGLRPTILDADGSSFIAVLNGNNCQKMADLFCAAPDLIKACKELITAYGDIISVRIQTEHNALISAIKKAEKGRIKR